MRLRGSKKISGKVVVLDEPADRLGLERERVQDALEREPLRETVALAASLPSMSGASTSQSTSVASKRKGANS